jgi:hypothetical protein
MALPHYHRPGTHWYVGDGFLWDSLPSRLRGEAGRPAECSARLFLYNPQDRPAAAVVRFYFTDREPVEHTLPIAPGAIETLPLGAGTGVPHNESFWIEVEADLPVLPQARHEDYTFWDPVPDALVSVLPYPGPLADETTWIYPDCFQGGPRTWQERETLTILNPGDAPATVRLRYLLRGREGGGEETIEIPPRRIAALELWERSPRLLGSASGPPIRLLGDYATRIDASRPVVTQITRRARWAGYPQIVGARSGMAFPLRAPGHELWHYPGGAILDFGVLPRDENCDVTWNLLFTHNLDERETAHATITFHDAAGNATRSAPLPIPPMKSDLQWLHRPPWLGTHTRLGEPWAMTVAADRPVVPEVTCAEFEMWSQVCPGAMSSVNFYPGPLTDETTWWLGIGEASGGPDGPAPGGQVVWEPAYHLFNPGTEPVRITLSFPGAGNDPPRHALDLPPGAVRRVTPADVAGFPYAKTVAVRADGDRPFVAQAFARTFTRGLPHTRAMYANMGLPMRLEGRPG